MTTGFFRIPCMRHNPTLFLQLVERLNFLEKRRLFLHEYEFSIAQGMQKRDSQAFQRITTSRSAGVISGRLFCRDMTTVTPNMDYVATLSARNKSRSRSRYLATRTLSHKLIGLQYWIRDQQKCVSSQLKYLSSPSFVRQ